MRDQPQFLTHPALTRLRGCQVSTESPAKARSPRTTRSQPYSPHLTWFYTEKHKKGNNYERKVGVDNRVRPGEFDPWPNLAIGELLRWLPLGSEDRSGISGPGSRSGASRAFPCSRRHARRTHCRWSGWPFVPSPLPLNRSPGLTGAASGATPACGCMSGGDLP